jgi:hypothetical protein
MAKKPLRIADALGFGSSAKPYVSPYLREVSKIKPGQKLPGTITRAPRPSAATELAQLLTPNTRFGNELAAKIAPAVEMSPLGVLTGLVDARRAYEAGDVSNAASTGILAGLGAVPGGKAAKIAKIKISDIEHGESIFPGGKLTWPGSRELIKKYAEMDTPFPAIELIKNDPDEAVPYMIYDGSHRLEAAKLRGDKYIDAMVVGE